MIEAVVSGLILAAVLAALAVLRKRWWPWPWPRMSMSSRIREAKENRTQRVTTADRQAQIAEATSAGEVVALSAVGSNPTRVKWTGATDAETFHYSDLGKYKRDMSSGRVPHLRAFCCGRPSRIGDRRTAPQPR